MNTHSSPALRRQGPPRPAGHLQRLRAPLPDLARAAPDVGRRRPALEPDSSLGCSQVARTRFLSGAAGATDRPGGRVAYAPGRPPTTRRDADGASQATSDPDRWWHGGVFYQIYPRSYADSNGDGVGDLPGIISKLDHLARLGITGVWLSPVTCSPNRDWGYDVSDYRDIDPAFGTLDDLDTLVREAGARGIRILMDLVPNHTSDQHPWFVDALSGRDSAHRDYYVWADPKPDGSPPNNWVSIFGGPAWELDEASGQYFLHNFEAAQPDLNWWNEDVRREFDDIVRFWWDRGVAGFRIDVCNMMIKDKELRDNPPATEDDPLDQQFMGVRAVYNTDRPEAHDILRRWRAIADSYEPERLLIGETNVEQLPDADAVLRRRPRRAARRLQLRLHQRAVRGGRAARASSRAPRRCSPRAPGPSGRPPTTTSRAWPTRWAGGDPAKVKVALLHPAHPAGDALPLPGRRDRPGRRADRARGRARPGRHPLLARTTRAATPSARRCPGTAGPAAASPRRACAPGCPWPTPPRATWPTRRATPTRCSSSAAGPSRRARASDDLAVGPYRSLPSPEGTWAFARGEAHHRAAQHGGRPGDLRRRRAAR